MAAPGGFSFGSSATKPGGFSFGTPSATTTASVQPSTGGFSFGSTAPATQQTGFKLGAPAASTAASALTLSTPSLGATTTSAPTGFGLGLNAGKPAGLTLGTSTASTGFSLGGATSTPSTGLGLGGTPSTGLGLGGTTSTGFGLGGTTSTGLGLGGTTSTGLGLGGTTSTGLGLGGTTSTTGTGFSLGGATSTASSSGFKLGGGLGGGLSGGLGGGLGTTISTGSGLTLGAATTTASRGLGGVDPASLASSKANNGAGNNITTTSDSKAIKESHMPNEIVTTVESFKEYVKKQKGVREEISRFSSKPLHRVREETIALKQLLAVVSNGLQRNAVAIHKLKLESGQELKNVELAHRTQEIPPALQIENTAPTEYFQRLVEHFEEQMILCRQQIEQLESYMASLAQPTSYTPQELSIIMVKLNETFIALAGQLQSVHEAVKAQKDLYLNYRRVYHGDIEDIFAARKRTVEHHRMLGALPTGPVPFDSSSNAAALAMATALQTAQKPPGLQGTGLGSGTGGLGTTSKLGGGLGATTGLGTGLGTCLGMGLGTGLGTTGGLGTGLGGGLGTTSGFGTTGGLGTQTKLGTGLGTTGFGTGGLATGSTIGTATAFPAAGSLGSGSLSAGPTLGGGSTGFGFGGATTNTFGQTASSTVTGRPVQLQKPPSKFRKGTR